MRRAVLLAVLVLAAPPARAAGAAQGHGARVTYDVGAPVPVGGREGLLDDAVLFGLTAAYEVTRYLAVVASAAGARTETEAGWHAERTLLQYDAGVQGELPLALGAETTVVPFVGAGLGARTLDASEVAGGVDTDLTGYLALGGRLEYGFGLVALTVRDLVSAPHRPWLAHPRDARHELAAVASFGLRF